MADNRMIRCLGSAAGERFAAYWADCVDVLSQFPDNSVDLSVFSPPFSGLYIYNDSIADMGNVSDDAEFIAHYRYFVTELFRITKPGRHCWVHCKDLVYYRTQRATAGLRDFPGDLIRAHVDAGFDYHSRRTIWRCPVREMTKTKAQGLLYKQLRADSTFSRAGLPEYFVTFRKWAKDGQEFEPVTHTKDSFPLPQWQEWASPVWMTTRETDVLDAQRDPRDEKHICALPLDLIERAIILGSNPGDVVLDPFAGIGSVGVTALKLGRRAVAIELKETYFHQAARNIGEQEKVNASGTLFDTLDRGFGR